MKALTSPLASIAASFLILQSFIIIGQAVDPVKHYCSRNASNPFEMISGETEGSIYTLYPGDSHYRNNQECVWMIDAGEGNRVEITVVSSELQWAPQSAICPGYDHVAIKDGVEGGEESIVLQWCGLSQPQGAISSGRYVGVEFMSDKNNPYKYRGVHLKFKTFASSDCAPSWSVSPTSFCFKLLDKETDWSSAQRECNADHANLASVTSEEEHEFLLQTFGSAGRTAWIGLSDIVQQGRYEWIDGSELTVSKFSPSHSADKYFRCVALQFTEGTWDIRNCGGYQTKPLCKSNKGKKTTLFPIPQEREEDNDMPAGTVIGIIVAVVALVILLLIAAGLYFRAKSRDRKADYQTPQSLDRISPRNLSVDAEDGRNECRNQRGSHRASAPPAEASSEAHVIMNPRSEMIAPPPAYEEALSHPVLSSPQKKT